MNRYGKGPAIIRCRRAYMVEAECRMKASFYARSAEEAEDDLTSSVPLSKTGFPALCSRLQTSMRTHRRDI